MKAALRIRELMKERKMTLRRMALELGITSSALYILLRTGNMRVERLTEIAEILGVDISELFESKKDYITCPHCGERIYIKD
jgi:transcriptional regulator with XRE-family HTH domain